MLTLLQAVHIGLLVAVGANAVALPSPFDKFAALSKRDGLNVDLGYATYSGVVNSTTGLNTFKG